MARKQGHRREWGFLPVRLGRGSLQSEAAARPGEHVGEDPPPEGMMGPVQ